MENSLKQFSTRLFKNPSSTGFVSLHPIVVIAINTVVCSAIAVFLWLVLGDFNNQPYWTVWIYSQCIGQTLCIMMICWSFYTARRPTLPAPIRAVVYVGIVLFGYTLGNTLGSLINGHTVNVIPTQSIFFGSFLLSALVALASTWFYDTRVRLAKLQLQASEAQLSMLKAQIEPHMLFNTLANLRVLIAKNPKDAQELLDQLIEFLRATLDSSRNLEGTVGSEFKILENYLALMKTRFGDRLNYSLHLPTSLSDTMLPTLLLQPLVENAIKHGIEPFTDPAHLDVNAKQKNKELILTVKNTGLPMDTAIASDGFGLESVRERLNETYRSSASITFTSPLANNEGGTLVMVTIPLNHV